MKLYTVAFKNSLYLDRPTLVRDFHPFYNAGNNAVVTSFLFYSKREAYAAIKHWRAVDPREMKIIPVEIPVKESNNASASATTDGAKE